MGSSGRLKPPLRFMYCLKTEELAVSLENGRRLPIATFLLDAGAMSVG